MREKKSTPRPQRAAVLAGVALLGSCLLLLAVTGASAAWSVVSSPNVGTDLNDLSGVAAVSSIDAWAVGTYRNQSAVYRTLTEHWNGSQWSVVSSPNLGAGYNLLNGVAAVSSFDVWAVGQSFNGAAYQTLTEHWNGSTWSVVPSPNVGTGDSVLTAVAALSSSDVWAAGYSTALGTLTEHWNGTAWSVVPTPSGNMLLSGVSGVSSRDVWAVGRASSRTTLALHWNGGSWQAVPSPNGPSGISVLSGVKAIASNDVWAVGSAGSSTLTENWNGIAWAIVSSPSPVNGNNSLFGVAGLSSSDLWAAGNTLNFTLGGLQQTLLEHWNGGSWSVVSSPNVGTGNNTLLGVTVAPGTAWAVGHYNASPGSPDQTLILQFH